MRVLPRRLFSPFLILLVILVLALPLYFFVTRQGKLEEVVDEVRDVIKSRAEVAFENFHFTERVEGERKWEVWADRAERFVDDSRIHMDGVKVEFLLKQGEWGRLWGREGDYFEKEKRAVLSGDVRVETDGGYRVYGDRMVWEAEAGLLRSDLPVRMVTDRYMVRGDRMLFWTDEKRVQVDGGVRAVIASDRARQGRKP
ncbi:MAG: LPS export ABC transporter periplasmic protein LptC [bacterium]|nr:LPS export ABC transporter periplasmic protein LptC [bacterium]